MNIPFKIISVIFVLITFTAFVSGADPIWNESAYNISYFFNEDQVYRHNFTADLIDFSQLQYFSILSISWSENNSLTSHSSFRWLVWNETIFSNSSTGILNINSTLNNETGNFTLNVHAQGSSTGQSAYFNFIINATNDAPDFTNNKTIYNLSQSINFLDYINASDEEEHYPLFFNITFFDNCVLAAWSTRTNCSIFSLSNVSDTSAIMNFTPSRNDVGTYYANITVFDWGENYSCPHSYCDSSIYSQNKSLTAGVITFNVLSSLEINASDCQNKIFQENQSGSCIINITSKGETDLINITSNAAVRNFASNISNSSWFYPDNSTNASNFVLTAYINFTPQKTEIGNWTINFTAYDATFDETMSEMIYVYVNRTINDAPILLSIPDTNTSVNLEKAISLTVYDDDLLIPDKIEGYNETTAFSYDILNKSNLSQILSLSNFSISILRMPALDSGLFTNRTEAEIRFTANSSDIGDYTINLTVNDNENSVGFGSFNLSILSNEFPVWNQTLYYFELVVNSTFGTTAGFGPINLTGDGYVTDTDTLTFTNNSDASPGFNLSSNGVIDFTPWKKDVGYWSFSVTATDLLGLQNTTIFIFNISNINSNPIIERPISVVNASVDINSEVIAQEDNSTTLTLWINDEDFRVSASQKAYFNESVAVNLTIEGTNPNLFIFVRDSSFPTPGNNRSKFTTTFIPNHTDTGSYNITINVTDASNSSDFLEFNLTLISQNDVPILDSLLNQTSAINRSLYYDINASDEEDGSDSGGNLTFSYSFLNGTDFINNNGSLFNTTSGILNITFNDTQYGIYRINISVNDSFGLQNSGTFWAYVYGIPNVTYPGISEVFNLQENSTSNLTFRADHSIKENLTYEFYVNQTLKYNATYYGNDTDLTWQFTPHFTDETYGQIVNLTLVVYPINPSVANIIDLNSTVNWALNVTHSNSPVVFEGYIGDKQATYNQEISVDLSQYFSDIDYNDPYYNQTINFSVASNSTPSYIIASISNWTLTLSSSIAVTEILNVVANDSSSTSTSNNFEIRFTAPVTVTTPTTGGGTTIVPILLKIIVPDPSSAYQKERIVMPLIIQNQGTRSLSGVNLSGILAENSIFKNDVSISFDKSFFDSLTPGQKENVSMTVDIDTEKNGTLEITINANVESPKYHDWAKIYINIKEGNISLLERLLFTQEFLQENPECIELEELLDEARAFFKEGDFVNTVIKIQEAINGCKNAISQQARSKRKDPDENKIYRYLFITAIIMFFLGLAYYSYKRIKLKRSSGVFVEQNNDKNLFKSRTILIFLACSGIFFFLGFISIKTQIIGFIVSESSSSYDKLSLTILFFISVLVFLIFLNREDLIYFLNRRIKKIPRNRINGLITKNVYSDSGDYVGKVEEVCVGEDRIDSIKIKLDKKLRCFKMKGIIIDYNEIQDVGQVVLINKKSWGKILNEIKRGSMLGLNKRKYLKD